MNTMVPTEGAAAAGMGGDEQNQYLTFALGGDMFAIDILHIKEIIEYGTLTAVPMMPAFIRGVLNLRGAVVPVVDLASRFGRALTEITRKTCIVIIEVQTANGDQDVGVIVDAVSEVLEIPPGEIEPPPTFGAKIRAEFIAGMGKVNGRFVIILDVDRVLSMDEMTLISKMGEEEVAAAVG